MPKKRTESPLEKTPRNAMQSAPRGKNAGAQTNGQFENDLKRGRGRGQFVGAGDAPRMAK